MDTDVIVIGAGAAGLSSARLLGNLGARVTVLEARDRTGGRVWSTSRGADSFPAELGGEFVHGPAPETRRLLREAGTTAVETGGDSWAWLDGDLQREEDEFSEAGSIFDGARSLPADESVERYLQRFAGDAAMREKVDAARAFVEGFDAADPAIASAQAIADEWGSGVDSISARPVGGYRPLFEFLTSACIAAGAHISLSSVVSRISRQRAGVVVEYTTAGGSAGALNARAAIVTVPVGVLRGRGGDAGVAFEPPLQADRLEALRAIEMGDVVKVALWFRTRFWERIRDGRYREAGFFRRDRRPFAVYWTQWPIPSGMIVAWAGGPKAAALVAASEAELTELALQGFGELLGEPALAHAEFEGAAFHNWARDPFARGAYSYVAVGGAGARLALAAPIDGTIFFAGEATSNDGQGGTVNGAFETGERAAREAATSLGIAIE